MISGRMFGTLTSWFYLTLNLWCRWCYSALQICPSLLIVDNALSVDSGLACVLKTLSGIFFLDNENID